MRDTLAVDAQRRAVGSSEWLVCGSGSTGYVSIDRRCEGNRTPEKLERARSPVQHSTTRTPHSAEETTSRPASVPFSRFVRRQTTLSMKSPLPIVHRQLYPVTSPSELARRFGCTVLTPGF
ncbi:hypothetical protein C8039_19060 [Halogeometricum sp. wsp3]|nr:hypothetical protein C8039_19060 [Halogeometricum sp. wsp3]